MKRAARHLGPALPWLIACLHAPTWADPMRPLVLPAAASAPAAPPGALAVERGARPKEADAGREPERLVAIRQDSASRWLALFGERWVKNGDRLDNYTVASIEGNTVQLADGKQRRTLHLLPPLSAPGGGKALAPGDRPPPDRPPPISQSRPPAQTQTQTQTAALSSVPATGVASP